MAPARKQKTPRARPPPRGSGTQALISSSRQPSQTEDLAEDKPETDPSDWDSIGLPTITPLDSTLRCCICRDFYSSPVITGCGHTFCSLCVRRALAAKQRCPVCWHPQQEGMLRRNIVVQEFVDIFVGVRARVIGTAEGVEGQGGEGAGVRG